MKQLRLVSATLAMAALCSSGFAQDADGPNVRIVNGGQMQVGRYTTVLAAAPEAMAQPLAAYVRVSYPRQTVATVGDAIHHTLLRTGWRLADAGLEAQARELLALPLPDSQRTLGPYRVRELLEVLTGPSWAWQQNQLQRMVWFTPKAGSVGQAGTETSVEPAPAVIAKPVRQESVPTRILPPQPPYWIN